MIILSCVLFFVNVRQVPDFLAQQLRGPLHRWHRLRTAAVIRIDVPRQGFVQSNTADLPPHTVGKGWQGPPNVSFPFETLTN